MIFDEIYNGDNVELIKKIDDESIDLTLTSPPYDNLRKYKGFQKIKLLAEIILLNI